MANIYDMTDSWTDGSTLTSIKMNVIDTSSAADSKLLDLQVGGSSKLTVGKDGAITAVQAGSVIPFYYDSQGLFPSAGTYHGAVAHSHNDAAMYFAHGGNWLKLVNADNSGNVGIGTSSPAYKFDVVDDVDGAHVFRVNNTSTGSSSGSFFQLAAGAAGGRFVNLQTNYTSQYFQLSGSNISTYYQDFDTHRFRNSAGTERMMLNSSGELLIGYTADQGDYKLQVNGTIFATSSTIATSDQRYKENVIPLTDAIDTVKALNPVQFDWKEHPVHEFDRSAPTTGFIAQEVQTALADKPWLNSVIKSSNVVIEPEQTDEDGNVIAAAVSEDFLGIAEGNLIAVLTAAIKEQQATIEALEARIAALESA